MRITRKRRSSRLLVVLLLLTMVTSALAPVALISAEEIQPGITVSGSLVLPNGEIAPSQGIHGHVFAYDPLRNIIASVYITIDAGQSSASFSFEISDNISEVTLSYSIEIDFEGYLSTAWYTPSGSTRHESDAVPIMTSENAEIIFPVLDGYVIQGIISLPEGEVAPAAGHAVYINTFDDMNSFQDNNNIVEIGSGLSDAAFSVTVPKDISAIMLQYFIDRQQDPSWLYMSTGYYSSSGTTYFYDQATWINPVEQNQVEMTLILRSAVIPAERFISGVIMLPDGKVAPEGGIAGSIKAESEFGTEEYSAVSFYIEEGQSSVSFKVSAADIYNPDATFKLFYNLSENEEYMPYGWFNGLGANTDQSDTVFFDLSQGDIEGVNLILPRADYRTISGVISLPEGTNAPAGGVSGAVWVSTNASIDYNCVYYILAGQNSTEYSVRIPVPATAGQISLRLQYTIFDSENSGYYNQGFYSSNGTQPYSSGSSAETIIISQQDISGINMAVFESVQISGTLRLPDGEITSDTQVIALQVNANDFYGVFVYPNYYNIPAGANSIEYSLSLPKIAGDSDVTYRLSYNLMNEGSAYFRQGYFSDQGTTPDRLAASPLDLSGPQTGLDMTLLRNNVEFRGKIILPDGAVSEDPREIMIHVLSENNESITYDYLTLAAGQNELDFMILVPENYQNKGYKLRYDLVGGSSDYYSFGYFADAGTVVDSSDASVIDLQGDYLDQLNLTLIKTRLLSGQITLEQGVAPAEGARVFIFAFAEFSNVYIGWASATIEPGLSTASYSLLLPQNAMLDGYSIKYRFYSEAGTDGFIPSGFRTETGTTSQQKDASLIADGAADVEGIDIVIPQNLPVNFPDPAFEAAVRLAIGKPNGTLMSEDVYGITSLSVSESGISNLSGLEAFVNLKSLNLENNQLIDITLLSSMTGLTQLNLAGNDIIDLAPLSGLIHLTELSLGNNHRLSNFNPIQPIYANLLQRDFEYVVVETNVGVEVEVVEETSGVTLTFEEVTEAGQTTIATLYTPPQADNYSINAIPVYYEISSSTTFTGQTIIEIPYNIEELNGVNESDLRLYQYKNGILIDITYGPVDTVNNIIRGDIGTHFCVFIIGMPNKSPVADAGSDQTIAAPSEGGWVSLDGSGSYDPDEADDLVSVQENVGKSIINYTWTWDGGTATGINPAIFLPIGVHDITLTVTDGIDERSDSVTIVVYDPDARLNSPPKADAGTDQLISSSSSGTWVTLDGSKSSDPDEIYGQPIIRYTWTWDGGTATGVNPTILLPIGVHDITLTVTDGIDEASDSVYIIVYDPSGGLATGGGWINVTDPASGNLGQASFGFIARYKNSKADGNFEFKYRDGDINLKSISVDWLVVNQARAMFQGTASLEGKSGLYTFRVALVDNAKINEKDSITIRIWEGTDTSRDPIYSAVNIDLSGGNIMCKVK